MPRRLRLGMILSDIILILHFYRRQTFSTLTQRNHSLYPAMKRIHTKAEKKNYDLSQNYLT
jgi:hypothetical protein